ncbi:hypothetical protein J8L85_00270 [Maribacter sp. MMG018]|uniref:hypothetical protein n=1 Tax=Maribacter sp. MMG018 TaxID=2822688 RepID=UPI001B38E39D|nr:hypothetical protein [Maribacter sp. MMG018]MBQ4912849.1 hypothetical protein [Maribacter sp. MMG018]
MKNVIIPIALFLIALSCSDSKDGDWDDNIKLSQKEVRFSSEAQTIQIYTEETDWWINEIVWNGESVDLNEVDTGEENFVIEEIEFSIERKNETEISISMEQNQTASERVLTISLQSGDYFDGITITQSGT